MPCRFGDSHDLVHLGRVPVEVHRHDADRLLGDGGFDGLGRDAEVISIDVGEHGEGAGEGDRVGGRRKCEGGDDDFVTGPNTAREESEVLS